MSGRSWASADRRAVGSCLQSNPAVVKHVAQRCGLSASVSFLEVSNAKNTLYAVEKLTIIRMYAS
jgi:hypothetical protein